MTVIHDKCVAEMITIRFASWISRRIVSLQPDTDIQILPSNGNRIRIRISKTLLSIYRFYRWVSIDWLFDNTRPDSSFSTKYAKLLFCDTDVLDGIFSRSFQYKW